jgi:hypothetical protein
VVTELIAGPHVAFNFTLEELITLRDYGVIGQMHAFVVELGYVVVYWRKSYITFFIYPYCQRVPISNKDPLTDIELLFANDQRILYIFLDNERPSLGCFLMLYYLIKASETFYASASRLTTRLENPDVSTTIDIKLREFLFKLIHKLLTDFQIKQCFSFRNRCRLFLLYHILFILIRLNLLLVNFDRSLGSIMLTARRIISSGLLRERGLFKQFLESLTKSYIPFLLLQLLELLRQHVFFLENFPFLVCDYEFQFL